MTKRDKYALKLKLARDVCSFVRAHPRSTTKQIFLAMALHNPYYAILIYSQRLDLVIDAVALGRIEASKSKVSAAKILKDSVHTLITKRAMRRSLMADLKRILAKDGDIIYGSGMFGQVHQLDMQPQDAAMYLAPRLSQMRNESHQYQSCIDMLLKSGQYRKEAEQLHVWSTNIRDQARVNTAHENVGMFFRRP
jgi:hypothetical protein